MNASLRAIALLMLGAALLLWAAGASVSNRDALLHIVQQQCLPHWRERHDPAPCLRLELPAAGGERQGFALLADRKGGAHLLLIPTRRLAGIESPELLEPGVSDYFAAAWQQRGALERFAGRALAPEVVGLAINPRRARGQDQLHIHIECLRPEVRAALDTLAAPAGPGWGSLVIGRRRYRLDLIAADDPAGIQPFQRLAAAAPGARARMGSYTLLVAATRLGGRPGFALLASESAPGAETLLDSSCLIAR